MGRKRAFRRPARRPGRPLASGRPWRRRGQRRRGQPGISPTATGGEWTTPRKLADTEQQIERLRHHVSEQCVPIASSIDTIPPEMMPAEMRDQWLRDLRQAAVALVPVSERLAGGPTT